MEDEKKLDLEQLDEVTGGSKQKYYEYTVKHGDTLIRISNHFHTTVEAIMRLNPRIKDKNFIVTGWVLKVPDNR